MKKKMEERILDEIRQRVIAEDRELKENREEGEIKKANFEVLAEMTSLSRDEVEEIARTVKAELLEKGKKRKKKIVYAVVAVFVVLLIAFIFRPGSEVTVVETFDDNRNTWSFSNSFEYKSYFEPNVYVFECNKEGKCLIDEIAINYPKNFDVLLSSQWLQGQFDSYGLSINKNMSNYFTFFIRSDGSASTGKVKDGEWVLLPSWQSGKVRTKEADYINVQRVEVRGSHYKFYVNDKFVEEGAIDMQLKSFTLQVCGFQKVAFSELMIINADNNEVIFEENFENPSEIWTLGDNTESSTEIIDGAYVFSTKIDGYFHVTSRDLQIDNHSKINLETKWIKGQNDDFGLMLLADENNFINCQIKSSGEGRIAIYKEGEYTYVGDFNKTGLSYTGDNSHTQHLILDGEQVQYFLDDKFVAKCELPFEVTTLRLFVGGTQTVSFENLEITRIE